VSFGFARWLTYRTIDMSLAVFPVSKPCGSCYSILSSLTPFVIICPNKGKRQALGFHRYSIVKVLLPNASFAQKELLFS
jgi:hypothetical protein